MLIRIQSIQVHFRHVRSYAIRDIQYYILSALKLQLRSRRRPFRWIQSLDTLLCVFLISTFLRDVNSVLPKLGNTDVNDDDDDERMNFNVA